MQAGALAFAAAIEIVAGVHQCQFLDLIEELLDFFIVAHLLVFFCMFILIINSITSVTSMEEDLLVAFLERSEEQSALALLEAFALEEKLGRFSLHKDSKNNLCQPQRTCLLVVWDNFFLSIK